VVSERVYVLSCLAVAAALLAGKVFADGVSGALAAVGVPAAQADGANIVVFAASLSVFGAVAWRRLPALVRRFERER